MDRAATAEPPLAAQAAPLDAALAAIPPGDAGIAWRGESPMISELPAELPSQRPRRKSKSAV